ncbi:septum formation family protein [Occultella kanbiaonis]|uniref:septum formation family protein n=1 Tax=Occultella kanbiaonis TaxID=2675754 RepID=UPI0013D7EEEE|nr:septum formation family protein [Occultella kanbiaonis]
MTQTPPWPDGTQPAASDPAVQPDPQGPTVQPNAQGPTAQPSGWADPGSGWGNPGGPSAAPAGGSAPQQGGYPAQQAGYGPQQQGGYAPQPGGTPQQGGYAPHQQGGYAPQPGGYYIPQPGGGPAGPGAVPAIPQAAPQAPAQPRGQSSYGSRPAPAAPGPQQPTGTGGYGQFTFPVFEKQKLEPMAVAAVATAPLGPVGLVLGLLARPRVRRTRRRSMNLAWAGIVIGGAFTVAWILVAVTLTLNGTIARATERPVAGDVDSARSVAAANLAVGNCIYTLPPAQSVGEVRLVPCAESHIAQVISTHELTGDFPGAEAVAAQATELCDADAAGIDAGDLDVMPWHLAPSAEGWEQGNTTVVCLVRGAAGPVEGDLVNG